MAAATSSLPFSLTFLSSPSSPSSRNNCLLHSRPTPALLLRHRPSSCLVVALSRRHRNDTSAITPKPSSKRNKQGIGRSTAGKEDDMDEDAFEALFRLLEEDLKNDESSGIDDDKEVSEEDLVKLERELEEAIGDEELLKVLDSSANESNKGNEDEHEGDEGENEDEDEEEYEEYDSDEEDDDDEDVRPVLKNWQLRRLAYALKKGRRKTNIKMLAAEICVDRALVLEYLREPPPSLLMLSAVLPDKPVQEILEPVTRQAEIEPLMTETTVKSKKTESKTKVSVHDMQNNWSGQKRLKKVHVETLEQVYRRTKRPTNSMVSNIVLVTNLPRKRVVKWFEDRRAEDGVPSDRSPYQRTPLSQTVFTSE